MEKKMEIEKMELKSLDIVGEKREQLKALFPEAFTEGSKIDFERLKLTLGEMVDPGKERYGMNWPGKADCFKIIQQPSIATLTPARDESVDFDTTENLFIEGDNLEVLKLLQKSYFGKVKLIYIDPPYNTGNDFIYPDDYSESLDTYLRYTKQIDDEGRRYSTNPETDGRFHSKWMNMMYPRLFLARNLLQEDGVIFISIDDREVDNLKKICDEVFGEQNLIAQVVWEKMYTTKNDSKMISDCHEYLIIYSKAIEAKPICLLPRSKEADERYSNPDNDHRGHWKAIPLYAKGERTRGRYPIKSTKTGKIFELPPNKHWLYIEEDTLEMIQDNRIWFGQDGNSMPNVKRFLSEVQQGMKPKTLWKFSEVGSNDSAKREIKLLFGENPPFDFPKPVMLMRQILHLSNSKNEIVLDFFSGSCTMAHATLDLNKEDGGNRKFIMVQLPEPTEENSEAFKAGYKTIADIGKERICRVIKKIKVEIEKKKDMFTADTQGLDLGFKVFKLQPSNFKLWDGETGKDKEAIENQIALFIEHINPQSSQEDILYELLLKSGFPLTTKIEKVTLAQKAVFSIADGSMLICLEKDLTPEVIKAMAEMKPVRVVCLDEGFKSNDQLKTNAVQIMKTRNITFRTV